MHSGEHKGKLYEEWFAENPHITVREGYSHWDHTIMEAAFYGGQDSIADDYDKAIRALEDIFRTLDEKRVNIDMINHCHKVAFFTLEKLGEFPPGSRRYHD